MLDSWKITPYSIASDDSNDNDNKRYPIVVSYFDEFAGKINTVLLSLCQTSINAGEGIFNFLKEELSKKKLPWTICLTFLSDNAYTMTEQFKGVIAFLVKVHPSIINIGCSCHLLHLAAKKATDELKSVNIEFLVHLYCYLDKSSERKVISNCLKNYAVWSHTRFWNMFVQDGFYCWIL